MTAAAIAFAILLGIGILLGTWYNGKKYGERKVQAETTQVGAETAAEHVQKLEEARAQDNEAARQKDLDEATTASSSADAALDFLLRSNKDGRGPGTGPR